MSHAEYLFPFRLAFRQAYCDCSTKHPQKKGSTIPSELKTLNPRLFVRYDLPNEALGGWLFRRSEHPEHSKSELVFERSQRPCVFHGKASFSSRRCLLASCVHPECILRVPSACLRDRKEIWVRRREISQPGQGHEARIHRM